MSMIIFLTMFVIFPIESIIIWLYAWWIQLTVKLALELLELIKDLVFSRRLHQLTLILSSLSLSLCWMLCDHFWFVLIFQCPLFVSSELCYVTRWVLRKESAKVTFVLVLNGAHTFKYGYTQKFYINLAFLHSVSFLVSIAILPIFLQECSPSN